MLNYSFKNKTSFNYKLINNIKYFFIIIKMFFRKHINIIKNYNFFTTKNYKKIALIDKNLLGLDLDFNIKLKEFKPAIFLNLFALNGVSIDIYLLLYYFVNNIYIMSYFFNTIIHSKLNFNKQINIKNLNFFNKKQIQFFFDKKCSIFMINYKFIDHKRYFNIKIKDPTYLALEKLTMFNLIKQRYGIGNSMSLHICKFLGISNNLKLLKLPLTTYYHKLSFFFSDNLNNIDNYLLEHILKNIKNKIRSKTYKGFRLLKGYPSNGQRTRSNFRTSIRKPYKFKFYYI